MTDTPTYNRVIQISIGVAVFGGWVLGVCWIFNSITLREFMRFITWMK